MVFGMFRTVNESAAALPMTKRQRSHFHVSLVLGQICSLIVVLAAYYGLWGLNWTWGGLGFVVALCAVCYSTCNAVSHLVIRPEPGLGPDDPLFLPHPPWWWVAARPLLLWLVIAVGPHNAWALLTVTGARTVMLMLELYFSPPLQGSFGQGLERMKHNKGSFIQVLDSHRDSKPPS